MKLTSMGLHITRNKGCVASYSDPGGGGGDSERPTWIHEDATAGVSFADGQAWIDGTLYTDLTELFGGNFDTNDITEDGYLQEPADGAWADPDNLIMAKTPLVTALADMNWAFRIKFTPGEKWDSCYFLSASDTEGNNVLEAKVDFSGSEVLVADWNTGDYNPAGFILDESYTWVRPNYGMIIAGSNSPDGWISSFCGDTAVINSQQSSWTAARISLFCNTDSSELLYSGMDAVIESIEFFPAQTAEQLEALAAIQLPPLPPYVRAHGAAAMPSGASSATVSAPASAVADDILIMYIESSPGDTIAAPAGWTELYTPQEGLNSKLTTFWRRKGASYSNPSISLGGTQNHAVARILAVANAITTGDPFEDLTGTVVTGGSTIDIPGVTTSMDSCLILDLIGSGVDTSSTTGLFNGWVNDTVQHLDRLAFVMNAIGDGGGVACFESFKFVAGEVGATTVTHATAESIGCVKVAIKPIPAA